VLAHRVVWLLPAAGAPAPLAAALKAAAPADAALLIGETVVAGGWLEGLREAAASDSLVATATALSNDAAFLSVPWRNRPYRGLPLDITLEDAAARVRERAARVRPLLPTALGHCVLLRRSALDLAGAPDAALDPSAAVVDLAQRCSARGLRHVAADDVLVLHAGDEPRGDAGPEQGVVAERHPHLAPLLAEARDDVTGPLGRALTLARQAFTGRRVTIDGRSLTGFRAGTQVHTLELIAALARTGEVRVRVLVPAGLDAAAADALAALEDVELLEPGAADAERDEVVHRPFQLASPADLGDLLRHGERLVVTQQDLIGHRTPGYFPSVDAWLVHRRLTREALAFADLVVFESEHARADALADDLVTPDRARLVPIGVDHRVAPPAAEERPPAGVGDRPFLLCLGTTFRHKNRPFALRLLHALREQHGWDGRLVLAGPDMPDGSSVADEEAWLLEHPAAAPHVVRLAAVDEREKAWLCRHAAAVLYPTTYEGFGLVPFEAASAGTACLWAPQSSLADVLPPDLGLLVPWDAEASAGRVVELLRDEARAAAHVEAVRAAAAELTWDRAAAALLDAYDEVVRLPAREADRLARIQSAYWGLRHDIGDTGLSLVGPEEPLLPPDAQRALAALARRGPTRRALLAALRWAARLGGSDDRAPTLDR
jgi:glycosyltransferase involved in cell wall biosynthesis